MKNLKKIIFSKSPIGACMSIFSAKSIEIFSRNVFIYENKFIHSRVETFNLNIYTHEKSY